MLRPGERENVFRSQPASGILQYLMETHRPRAIIVTGSYAGGTFDEASDFDCWLIGRDEGCVRHDTSTVNGVLLQAEIYPLKQLMALPERCLSYFVDVAIPYDPEGLAQEFMAFVHRRLAHVPCMPPARKRQKVLYLEKMLRRAAKQSADGDVRGHLMLYQSLQHWCDFTDRIYIGTRKTLQMLEKTDPAGARLFRQALRSFAIADMADWIGHLCSLAQSDGGRLYRLAPWDQNGNGEDRPGASPPVRKDG